MNIEVDVIVRDEATGSVHKIAQHTPNIINGSILQIQLKGHREYHDVCLKVSNTYLVEDEDMIVDMPTKGTGKSSNE